MKKIIYLLCISFLASCSSNAQEKENNSTKKTNQIVKTEAEWRAELTPQEYYVLREKGTDRPGDDGYTKHFEKGTYVCRACDAQLFESNTKYESHCGWPSFDDAIAGTVDFQRDVSAGMIRTEITCTKCGGHLGHVFDDGPKDTTGKRFCVNTSSIKFVPSK